MCIRDRVQAETKPDVAKVETPRFQRDSGTVAVLVHPNGTEEILKDSIPTEDGIRLTVDGSAMVKSINNSKDFIDVSADAYYARCRPLRPHRHLHPRTDCRILGTLHKVM